MATLFRDSGSSALMTNERVIDEPEEVVALIVLDLHLIGKDGEEGSSLGWGCSACEDAF